jgi:hypothetical protein
VAPKVIQSEQNSFEENVYAPMETVASTIEKFGLSEDVTIKQETIQLTVSDGAFSKENVNTSKESVSAQGLHSAPTEESLKGPSPLSPLSKTSLTDTVLIQQEFKSTIPDSISMTPPSRSDYTESSSSTRQCHDWYQSTLYQLRSEVMVNEKEYIPGDIYWLHSDQVSVPAPTPPPPAAPPTSLRQGNQEHASQAATVGGWVQTRRVVLSRVDRVEEVFSEVFLSRSMLMDHSPGRLEGCLDALKASTQ